MSTSLTTSSHSYYSFLEINNMNKQCPTTQQKLSSADSQEVGSIRWELTGMSDEEEDLIFRMYRLVGKRWHLIAGRLPGRKPEEIERFWMLKQQQVSRHVT